MIYVIAFLGTLAFLAVLLYAVYKAFEYRSTQTVKGSREKSKTLLTRSRSIANLRQQVRIAEDALNKITADYTHNPQLEARVALDNMAALDIERYEIESNS